MDFFISNAWAEGAAAAPQEPGLMSFLPLIAIFVIFYFLMIRPQAKKAKEHRQMVSDLAKGDEVVTNGGLAGKITEVGDSFAQLELTENVTVKVQKQSVSAVLPKGTLKGL